MNWLRQLFTRRQIYNDLSEEIQQHLAEKVEALIADGMSRRDAEFAAKREFGNITRIEESGHQPWMWPRAESILAAAVATGTTGRAGSPRPATGARFPADRAPQRGWQLRDDRAGRRNRAP